ncbi:MAG: phosphoadenosine phosphosulfate reductase, partial [Novosphingobium sp. 16-62-11]
MTSTVNRKIDLIDARPRFVETDAIRLNQLFRGSDTQEMLRSVIRDGLAGD